MKEIDIRDKCSIVSNYESDDFVGLKSEDGDIRISFPIGYHISDNNEGLRNDIFLLFKTLATYIDKKDSKLLGQVEKFSYVEFPLQSYMYLISDYLLRGYYKENEVIYNVSKSGKINWSRTIKTQKPYIQNNNVFFIDFVTKKHSIEQNQIITLIHQFCVYESFQKLGWLYTKSMPRIPHIKKDYKVFKACIIKKLLMTFNDHDKQLFGHMLSIIDFQGDEKSEKNYKYGTYRFEYVWEKMIDRVFGIKNKKNYYPKSTWKISGENYNNVFLRPGTIMLYHNNIYILDAKYYKYGTTGNVRDLPGTVSINKQITYGEYVVKLISFARMQTKEIKVYNAFLMPFDSAKDKTMVE